MVLLCCLFFTCVVLVRFILNRGKLDGAKLRVGVRNLKLKIKKIKCKIDKRNFPKYKGEFTLDCSTHQVDPSPALHA